MTAERQPNGFKCCALRKSFNDLLLGGESKTSLKYSYRVEAISLPNGKESLFGKYHIHKDGELIYRTEGLGPIHATLIYDAKSKCLTSNLIHSMLPKELGGLSPPGMYMANVMAFDILMESGLLFIHGGAFHLDGKTICIFSPSQTGKTTVISMLIKEGAKYIGEDAILTDGKIVHLVPPHRFDKFSILSKENIIPSSKIDHAYICDYGKKNGADKRSKAISYLRIYPTEYPSITMAWSRH